METVGTARRAGRDAFACGLALAGWSERSAWGYDDVLECFWVELWRDGDDAGPALRISPEHLISTVSGLARAMAFALEVGDDEAYLALTA